MVKGMSLTIAPGCSTVQSPETPLVPSLETLGAPHPKSPTQPGTFLAFGEVDILQLLGHRFDFAKVVPLLLSFASTLDSQIPAPVLRHQLASSEVCLQLRQGY